MYYLTLECGLCHTTALIPIKCYGEEGHVLISCAECPSIWYDLDMDGDPYIPQENNWQCPYHDGYLIDSDGVLLPATREEIEEAGWGEFIHGPVG